MSRSPVFTVWLPCLLLASVSCGLAPHSVRAVAEAQPFKAPGKICDVKSFGAKGDGVTVDTAAVQAAINACAGKHGTVRLEKGTFLSGMVRLGSDMTFDLEPTATLKGTQNDDDYPPQTPPSDNTQLKQCRKALVYAEGVQNLVVEGGTINGNGNVGKWLGPRTLHPEATRPMPVFTVLSRKVTFRNITIRDGAMWGLVNMETDDLTIDHVTIDSQLSGNRDGIDIVDCHHVTVTHNTIASEDDSICFKSGTARGVVDARVSDNHILRSGIANALKFGTASFGGFKDVLLENNVIDSADKAAMAVESVDGGAISNIVFRNITFHDAGTPIFILLGDRGTTPRGERHRVGSIDGIRFENVRGDSLRYHWSSPISGTLLPDGSMHRLAHLTFDHVKIVNKGGLSTVPGDPPEYAGQYPDPNLWGDMPSFGFFIRHADHVRFIASTTTVAPADARRWLEQRDVTDLTVN